jgi:hypothetical protein
VLVAAVDVGHGECLLELDALVVPHEREVPAVRRHVRVGVPVRRCARDPLLGTARDRLGEQRVVDVAVVALVDDPLRVGAEHRLTLELAPRRREGPEMAAIGVHHRDLGGLGPGQLEGDRASVGRPVRVHRIALDVGDLPQVGAVWPDGPELGAGLGLGAEHDAPRPRSVGGLSRRRCCRCEQREGGQRDS